MSGTVAPSAAVTEVANRTSVGQADLPAVSNLRQIPIALVESGRDVVANVTRELDKLVRPATLAATQTL